MYAYLYEIRGGFFEGVCTLSNATANIYDPPPPLSAKESEPRQWGSGPKRVTRRSTVCGDLA